MQGVARIRCARACSTRLQALVDATHGVTLAVGPLLDAQPLHDLRKEHQVQRQGQRLCLKQRQARTLQRIAAHMSEQGRMDVQNPRQNEQRLSHRSATAVYGSCWRGCTITHPLEHSRAAKAQVARCLVL